MSFLQAASAKIITNKLLNKQQADTASFGGGLDIHTLSETLRLLLVEEECEAINNCDGKDNNCDGKKDFTTDEDKDLDGEAWCAGDCDDNNPNLPKCCRFDSLARPCSQLFSRSLLAS